jgi:hypothetical protein
MPFAPCAQVRVLPHALQMATEMTLAFRRRRWPGSLAQTTESGWKGTASLLTHPFLGADSIRVEGASCRLDYLSPGNP